MAKPNKSQPKKSTSKLMIVLYFFLAVFAIGGFSSLTDGKIAEGIIGIGLAAICVSLIFWLRIARKKKNTPKVNQASRFVQADQPSSPHIAPNAARTYTAPVILTLPQETNGFEMKYKYEDVAVAGAGHYDVSAVKPGSLVKFKLEPDNQYDAKAISLHVGEVQIGYLPKNRLQDMAHDFLTRGGDIAARVTAVEGETVKIILGFYEHIGTPYENLVESGAQFKSYKLTANGNEEMQENLSLCSVGDEVDANFNFDKDKYLAIVGSAEIGFFPKAASSTLEGAFQAFISDVDTDDNGKYYAKVDVFTQ